MVAAHDIPPAQNVAARALSNAYWSASASPSTPIPSPLSSSWAARGRPSTNVKHLKPFATEDIKVLLLENINPTGRDLLQKQGYQIEFLKSSLAEDELIDKLK